MKLEVYYLYAHKTKDEWTVFVEKNAGWFMYRDETPKNYADAMAKFMNEKPDYGPCFWRISETPEELSYELIGEY
jgi:hypothetical protein